MQISSAVEPGRRLSAAGSCALLCALLAACSASSDSYFPLARRGRWFYNVVVTTPLGERQQRYVVENVGRKKNGGEETYVRRDFDGRETYFREIDAGIVRIGEKSVDSSFTLYSEPRIVVPRALDDAASWIDLETTIALEMRRPPELNIVRITETVSMHYEVEAIDDEVVVPAGRFTDCLRVRGSGSTRAHIDTYGALAEVHVAITRWYARGVGLVKLVREESTSSALAPAGRYEMTLASYSTE